MTREEAEEAAKELVQVCTWSLENANEHRPASLFIGARDVQQLLDVLLVLLEGKS